MNLGRHWRAHHKDGIELVAAVKLSPQALFVVHNLDGHRAAICDLDCLVHLPTIPVSSCHNHSHSRFREGERGKDGELI